MKKWLFIIIIIIGTLAVLIIQGFAAQYFCRFAETLGINWLPLCQIIP